MITVPPDAVDAKPRESNGIVTSLPTFVETVTL
jgi:hypothetical protein